MPSDDHRDDQTPDTPADPREQARAASFAALVDRLVAGHALPPVMPPEERVLIETAAMVRASTRELPLAPERQRALIDGVLARPAGSGVAAPVPAAGAAGPGPGPARATERAGSVQGDAIDLGERRRGRYVRVLPWAVAAASAAAALLLALWQSQTGGLPPASPRVVAETAAPAPDPLHLSRPADALVGEIPRSRADAARARIDMIYADRLIGYRDLHLRGSRL